MTTITALVPMRHNSQRVPGKNYRELQGKPLFHYILETLSAIPEITNILVDTDSEPVIAGMREYFPKARVIRRPEHLRAPEIPMNEILAYDCDQIGGRNNSWYCNREVDKLLKDALNTTDQDLRRKNYERAAVMVMEDAAGLFVYNTKWYGPFSKRVKGIRFCPVGDGQEMRWASME